VTALAIPNEMVYGHSSSSAFVNPCLGPGHRRPQDYLLVDHHHINERWVQQELLDAEDGHEPDGRAVPLCPTHHRMVHLCIDALKAGRKPPTRSRYLVGLARETLRREAEMRHEVETLGREAAIQAAIDRTRRLRKAA
jgi:hypothetical protein